MVLSFGGSAAHTALATAMPSAPSATETSRSMLRLVTLALMMLFTQRETSGAGKLLSARKAVSSSRLTAGGASAAGAPGAVSAIAIGCTKL